MRYVQIVMRCLQIIGFLGGLAAFLASAYYTGSSRGETLWKTGIGFMLSDITLILLWPTGKRIRE